MGWEKPEAERLQRKLWASIVPVVMEVSAQVSGKCWATSWTLGQSGCPRGKRQRCTLSSHNTQDSLLGVASNEIWSMSSLKTAETEHREVYGMWSGKDLWNWFQSYELWRKIIINSRILKYVFFCKMIPLKNKVIFFNLQWLHFH